MARRGDAGERNVEAVLERERELIAMRELLERAGLGLGSRLVVEGTGIGKMSLVRAARALARERGLGVLRARGSDHERDFAYGVVRQLFEPRLATAPARERAAPLEGVAGLATTTLEVDGSWSEPEGAGGAPADDRSSPAFQGLYWLCANLAGLARCLSPSMTPTGRILPPWASSPTSADSSKSIRSSRS